MYCNPLNHEARVAHSVSYPMMDGATYFPVAVFPDPTLSARVEGDPVQKYNTAVLRCRVSRAAAGYTEVVAWIRGNTHLFPSPRGGE